MVTYDSLKKIIDDIIREARIIFLNLTKVRNETVKGYVREARHHFSQLDKEGKKIARRAGHNIGTIKNGLISISTLLNEGDNVSRGIRGKIDEGLRIRFVTTLNNIRSDFLSVLRRILGEEIEISKIAYVGAFNTSRLHSELQKNFRVLADDMRGIINNCGIFFKEYQDFIEELESEEKKIKIEEKKERNLEKIARENVVLIEDIITIIRGKKIIAALDLFKKMFKELYDNVSELIRRLEESKMVNRNGLIKYLTNMQTQMREVRRLIVDQKKKNKTLTEFTRELYRLLGYIRNESREFYKEISKVM